MDENNKSEEMNVRNVKPSMFNKIKRMILPEGETSFGKFLWNYVVRPMLLDGFWGGMDRIRYRNGGYYGPDPRRVNREGYTEYGKKSSQAPVRPMSREYMWDYENLYFTDAGFAAHVLDEMRSDIEHYHQVSVAAMYDYAGKSPSINGKYTYRNYGWKDLRNARVRPQGAEYIIDLPTPILLD